MIRTLINGGQMLRSAALEGELVQGEVVDDRAFRGIVREQAEGQFNQVGIGAPLGPDVCRTIDDLIENRRGTSLVVRVAVVNDFDRMGTDRERGGFEECHSTAQHGLA